MDLDRGMLQIFDAMSRDRNVTTQVKEGDGNVTSDDTPPPIKGDIKSRPLGIGDGLSQEPKIQRTKSWMDMACGFKCH